MGTTALMMRVAISIVVKWPPIKIAPCPLARAPWRRSRPTICAFARMRWSLLHQVLAVSNSAMPRLSQCRPSRSSRSAGDSAGRQSSMLRRAMRIHEMGRRRMILPRLRPRGICSATGSGSSARSRPRPTHVGQYFGAHSAKGTAVDRALSTPARVPHRIWSMYTFFQRLRSSRHRFWYALSERLRWSRGIFHEVPANELIPPDQQQAQKIAALQSRYQVKFERHLNAATSYNNYEYLDILDRAWSASGLPAPAGGELFDVGSASFWYAEALQAFFRP